jgi:hypothetical protein
MIQLGYSMTIFYAENEMDQQCISHALDIFLPNPELASSTDWTYTIGVYSEWFLKDRGPLPCLVHWPSSNS